MNYEDAVKGAIIRGFFITKSISINGKYIGIGESHSMKYHSNQFNWGYAGSGPLQLGLAMLLYFFPDVYALENYQAFTTDVIAKLPLGKDFDITGAVIIDWALKHDKETLNVGNG